MKKKLNLVLSIVLLSLLMFSCKELHGVVTPDYPTELSATDYIDSLSPVKEIEDLSINELLITCYINLKKYEPSAFEATLLDVETLEIPSSNQNSEIEYPLDFKKVLIENGVKNILKISWHDDDAKMAYLGNAKNIIKLSYGEDVYNYFFNSSEVSPDNPYCNSCSSKRASLDKDDLEILMIRN